MPVLPLPLSGLAEARDRRGQRPFHSWYHRRKRRVDRWAWRRCGCGSGVVRGCRTSWGRTWSSGSLLSRSRILASARSGSRRSSPASSGAGCASLRTGSGGCWAGTAEHAAAPFQPDRRLRRRLRAQTGAARAGAARRRLRAGGDRRARLFLRRQAVRHEGCRLAIHGDRPGLRLRLGGAAQLAKEPAGKHCSALVARVASELAKAGWQLKTVITDG